MCQRPQAFRLDATQLRSYQRQNGVEMEMGLSAREDGGIAGAIARCLGEAREAGAIGAPENVELVACAIADHVIVMVREEKIDLHSEPWSRAVASNPIDSVHLVEGREETVSDCSEALERCLARANRLLRPLALLQEAEARQQPVPDEETRSADPILRAVRLEDAVSRAQEAFWLCFAAQFPEATTGDLDPCLDAAFDGAARTAAEGWLDVNWPTPDDQP